MKEEAKEQMIIILHPANSQMFITLCRSQLYSMRPGLTVLFTLLVLSTAIPLSAQEKATAQSDKLFVNEIVIDGNNVTKKSVITREMMIAEGDSVLKMDLIPLLEKSRENLLNTSLFNFVTMDARHYEGNRIDILVSVTERWYIWPVPILEHADRNFPAFIENRDWSRINYGAWLKWENFRGRRELLTGKARLGYKEQYALSYSKPNLGKLQQHGIDLGFNFDRQHEIIYGTSDNNPMYYKDELAYAFKQDNFYFTYTYRKKIYTSHTLKFEYFDFWATDSVIIKNPDYFGNGNNRMNFFMFTYNVQYDNRDSRMYPLEGIMLKGRIEKVGLGLIDDFAYSNLWLTAAVLYHHELLPRLYFATANKAKYSLRKEVPYFHQKGLGYNEYLSGYESYLIDGTDYVITKQILQYMLIKQHSVKVPFIDFEQFTKFHYSMFIKVFADQGFVYNKNPDPDNLMANQFLYSFGIGLDFVTYYDQVLRLEYSYTKFGEGAFMVDIAVPFSKW